MDDDRERDLSATRTCPNCAASNPRTARMCAACGMPLDAAPGGTVIDVTGGSPRVVTVGEGERASWQGNVTTVRVGGGRMVVARGGRRACLVTLLVLLLLSACTCWLFWTALGALF